MNGATGPPGADRDLAPPAAEVVLEARLALPDGRFEVGAGELVRLPDDHRHVAALLGIRETQVDGDHHPGRGAPRPASRPRPEGDSHEDAHPVGRAPNRSPDRAPDRSPDRAPDRAPDRVPDRSRHHVLLAGRRLDRRGQAARARAGLVGVGNGAVAPDVTVLDHLVAVCRRPEAQDRLAGAPLLAHRGADPAGVLSGGERRVLDWLVADALRPRALVLDRPATGLDPDALTWAHTLLDRWLDAGVAALLRVGRADESRWLDQRADGRPREV